MELQLLGPHRLQPSLGFMAGHGETAMNDDVFTVPCALGCERRVNPLSRHTWHQIRGWARPGRNGGSDIAAREPLGDEYACDECVKKVQNGLNARQGVLL